MVLGGRTAHTSSVRVKLLRGTWKEVVLVMLPP